MIFIILTLKTNNKMAVSNYERSCEFRFQDAWKNWNSYADINWKTNGNILKENDNDGHPEQREQLGGA